MTKLEAIRQAGQALADSIDFSAAGAVFLVTWAIATCVVLVLYYKFEREIK